MYQVDGYVFTSKEKAKEAKKEAEGVAYIKEQTDLRNPDVVLKLYNKLLDDEVFSTEVGIGFLRELQEHLLLTPYIKREEIRPIPIREDSTIEREVERQHARETARRKKQEAWYENDVNGTYRTKYYVATFFCIVFAVALVGIFAITCWSGRSVTILNYENALIDRYESWEQQLEQREQELDSREQELIMREERLNGLNGQ